MKTIRIELEHGRRVNPELLIEQIRSVSPLGSIVSCVNRERTVTSFIDSRENVEFHGYEFEVMASDFPEDYALDLKAICDIHSPTKTEDELIREVAKQRFIDEHRDIIDAAIERFEERLDAFRRGE